MTPVNRNAGFALILALFLIVSLAAIAAYMVTISTGQVAAATQDEQAARAYQAARTGIEWGAYRVLQDSTYATNCAGSMQTQTVTFTAAAQSLFGFSVTVVCQSAGSETEGGNALRVYRITSTGCNCPLAGCNCPLAAPADATYVERQLQLTLVN
jgi:MSHA biogenesis protein MshP